MAEAQRKNRLSPPLMYVFRSAHVEKNAQTSAKVDARQDGPPTPGKRARSVQRVAVTEKTLREEVKRDLETLMNCISMDSSTDLDDFPAVRKSILNFGFPDVAHRTIDELSASDLDQEIANVLRLYEPRLVETSLRVDRDRSVNPDDLKIRYVVHADLSCEPLNVPLEFVADVEVTTGKIQIQRL